MAILLDSSLYHKENVRSCNLHSYPCRIYITRFITTDIDDKKQDLMIIVMIIDKFDCVWYQLKSDNWDRGIVFFALSRFTYAVFHNLLCYNTNSSNNSNNSKRGNMLFPNLVIFLNFFIILVILSL